MADPYAERSEQPPGESPAPGSPLARAVAEAGGRVLAGLEDAGVEPGGARFAALIVAEQGLLPPLARVSPEFAAALLVAGEPSRAGGGHEAAALEAARALRAAGAPTFLLKDGLVAGPEGRPGALALSPELVAAALRAALAGEVVWEADPDFGYEVAAAIPGIDGPEADAFCPRLVYAAADRVYEHAELVELSKRRRHAALEAAGVADERLHTAVGWPIEPTGSEWKD